MSVRKVTCPKCGNAINVPASMQSIKCQSCQNVFPATQSSATPAATNPYTATHSQSESQSAGNKNSQRVLIAAGASALALIALGLVGFLMVGSVKTSTPVRATKMPAPATQPPVAAPAPATTAPEYRVVDLPESTRQKIYHDYQQMMASSFGKAKRIPKSGTAGIELRGMLGQIEEREITHFALLHKVSEEDIHQILAEGKDKDWK
ncbi:zinc-ribbon domain-containing protein [Stieleria sp. TO1_6]|uniref:zinc-ribbon domain-containing protein n=1 Tax=Stieleria tagensis TaxID=2956795 RepID=UPI00209B0C1B|nr:zinc-ribbon domain-containing protein [Stieleria tagensis]MCO8121416.1 zinc-ribbon domain-containing protein [Stieleria tagensis]